MNRTNSLCIECLCNTCKCNQHRFVSYSYKGRIPTQNASKKEWLQFIDMFLSYDKEAKAIALKTLNEKQ